MTVPIADSSTYADFAGLDALKKGARTNDPAAVREVAKQFESLFARMMIKSMRDAVGTDPIFGSDQEKMYQGMFDDQLSLELTKGRGLGLADMLTRQLQRMGAGGSSTAQGTEAKSQRAASGEADGAAGANAAGASGTSGATGASGAARPASASGAAGPPGAANLDQTNFINEVWPQAQRAAAQLGVDPRGLVAQAALETNWGRNVPRSADGRSSNNLFGVKAGSGWQGSSVASSTREFQNGTAVTTAAQFRAYSSRAESFQDYVNLLTGNPRYASALNTGNDVQAFAAGLARGGYATDPDYARKVSSIAQSLPADPTGIGSLKSASALPISSYRSNGMSRL